MAQLVLPGRMAQARAHQLAIEPLCRMCHAEGQVMATIVADPVTPHRGDPELLWRGELQSLCTTWYSRFKQSEERGGEEHLRGRHATGEPLFFE
jgi:5-methylcytosine-specific restriction enzyme A